MLIQVPLGVLKALSGIPKDKNYLHNNTTVLLACFFTVLTICIKSAKALVSKTPSTFAGIRAVTLICTSSHCSRYYCELAVSKTLPGSFQTVLDEAVKIIKFIKF